MSKYISVFIGFTFLGYFLYLFLALPMMYLIGFIYAPIYGWETANLCATEIRTGVAGVSFVADCNNMAFNYQAITTGLSVGISAVVLLFIKSKE